MITNRQNLIYFKSNNRIYVIPLKDDKTHSSSYSGAKVATPTLKRTEITAASGWDCFYYRLELSFLTTFPYKKLKTRDSSFLFLSAVPAPNGHVNVFVTGRRSVHAK